MPRFSARSSSSAKFYRLEPTLVRTHLTCVPTLPAYLPTYLPGANIHRYLQYPPVSLRLTYVWFYLFFLVVFGLLVWRLRMIYYFLPIMRGCVSRETSSGRQRWRRRRVRKHESRPSAGVDTPVEASPRAGRIPVIFVQQALHRIYICMAGESFRRLFGTLDTHPA